MIDNCPSLEELKDVTYYEVLQYNLLRLEKQIALSDV